MNYPEKCHLCPRGCGTNRALFRGFCKAGLAARIARIAPHFWEEPCISGKNGSGTVFFSGCSLGCVFCQNHEISHKNLGTELSDALLADELLRLQDAGVHNINFVNPTHYTINIINALDIARSRLTIPVIWNSGGYELESTLEMLRGYVDIFLPDLKYVKEDTAQKYSGASDYFFHASRAIKKMTELVGYPTFDSDGMMKSGVLIRHLVLPSCVKESRLVIDFLSQSFDKSKLWLSLMSQYTPMHKAFDYPEISRRLTTLEYQRVVEYAIEKGLTNGFLQEKSSAQTDFVPEFFGTFPE